MWGRRTLEEIAWTLLSFSIALLLVLVVFILIAVYHGDPNWKIKIAHIYLISGVVLVLSAMLCALFYFVIVAYALSNADEHFSGFKSAGCFLDPGVNLAIEDF